jgi:hypothetical protein
MTYPREILIRMTAGATFPPGGLGPQELRRGGRLVPSTSPKPQLRYTSDRRPPARAP